MLPVSTLSPDIQYRLVDWTPKQADALIATLLAYPETLTDQERGRLDSYYAMSFRYAGLAEAEAGLRFPSDPGAIQWTWDSAYHRSLHFNRQADQIYGGLIADDLNSGKTDLQGLQAWFEMHEPRLKLQITQIAPLPSYTSSQVLSIWPGEKSITQGGIFIWLVEDQAGYHAYPLRDQQWFETGHDASYDIFLVDLTGDGIPEAVSTYGHRDAGINENEVEVFDLSQVPPRKLDFKPELDSFYLQFVPGWENEGGRIEFSWVPVYGDPVVRQAEYRWDGQVLRESSLSLSLHEGVKPESVLTDTLTTSMLLSVESGNKLLLDPLIEMLKSYPLGAHPLYTDNPYPPDARDELRFRLGIALAFQQDASGAIQQMQSIVDAPVVPTSTWITPAQQFLKIYQQPKDLLAACMVIRRCSLSYALPDLLTLLSPTNPILPIDLLRDNGENFLASGAYDFNHDGVLEYWGIKPSSFDSSLEIIYTANRHYEKQTFDYVTPITNTAIPTFTIIPLPPLEGAQVYKLEGQDTNFPFVFSRSPEGDVRIIELGDQLDTLLQESEIALLAGGDPKQVLNRLIALGNRAYYEGCEGNTFRSICLDDHYLYLYSLAQELAGDREGATAAYLQLWQTYPDSPYTILAQAKLEPIP